MDEKLVCILNEMADFLSIAQMKKLQEVLLKIYPVKHRRESRHLMKHI